MDFYVITRYKDRDGEIKTGTFWYDIESRKLAERLFIMEMSDLFKATIIDMMVLTKEEFQLVNSKRVYYLEAR